MRTKLDIYVFICTLFINVDIISNSIYHAGHEILYDPSMSLGCDVWIHQTSLTPPLGVIGLVYMYRDVYFTLFFWDFEKAIKNISIVYLNTANLFYR